MKTKLLTLILALVTSAEFTLVQSSYHIGDVQVGDLYYAIYHDNTQAYHRGKYFYFARVKCKSAVEKTNYSTGDTYTVYNQGWNITSVNIPSSITAYGHECPVLEITKCAFADCTSLKSVIIGDSVTQIFSYAFSGCSSLASVTIGNGVTSIGDRAFDRCFLSSLTIGESLESVGRFPLEWGCDTLIWNAIDCPSESENTYKFKPQKCLYIGNKVKRIPDYCFAYSGISTVTIPKSVTQIGEKTFYNCSNLESVYIENPTPIWIGSSIFTGTSSSLKIYVPCGSINAYKNAPLWTSYGASYISLIQYPAATAKVMSANKQEGDVSAITICDTKITATAKYGYHFTQWSDGNKDNPRYIDPTEDVTYVAEFAPNQYTITLNCDAEQGKVEGAGTFDYLTNIKISATPNEGYLFVMWSDYNMSDTRTIKVEKDLSLTAIFVSDLNALNDVKSNNTLPRKVMKDGQLFILRDGKTYTVHGQEVK